MGIAFPDDLETLNVVTSLFSVLLHLWVIVAVCSQLRSPHRSSVCVLPFAVPTARSTVLVAMASILSVWVWVCVCEGGDFHKFSHGTQTYDGNSDDAQMAMHFHQAPQKRRQGKTHQMTSAREMVKVSEVLHSTTAANERTEKRCVERCATSNHIWKTSCTLSQWSQFLASHAMVTPRSLTSF